MTTNVLIGVGGTGAKVVEAALYLFFAGLGPSKVIVGLVDQDKANGNLTRTRELLYDLVKFRKDFSADNRLDWSRTTLGRVQIEPLFGDDPYWQPSADGQGSLAQILDRGGLDADRQALMDLLFLEGEEEQDMGLAQGYRGRAHVGAAAMLASLELGDGLFKKRMVELMKNATIDGDVRIFLVGSAFGGTGAAGFPTMARRINTLRKDARNGEKVKLGGALMLPYFSFADPEDETDNVVLAANLMPQAQAALQYYNQLFKSEPVFDHIYLAGSDKIFKLPHHSPGDNDQINPPLPSELLGAQAAIDFFNAPVIEASQEVGTAVKVCARAKPGVVGWGDLPGAAHARHQDTYDRLGQLLRTAVWWRFQVEPELGRRNLLGKLKAGWLQDLTRDVDFQVTETDEARKRLILLFDSLLMWCGAMRLYAEDAGLKFQLWNTEIVQEQADVRQPRRPIRIAAGLSDQRANEAYNAALSPLDHNEPPRSAAALHDELTSRALRDTHAAAGHRGFGRLAAMVHHAARAPTKERAE
jgi:hypothetical protein